jgi:hypothetical protein
MFLTLIHVLQTLLEEWIACRSSEIGNSAPTEVSTLSFIHQLSLRAFCFSCKFMIDGVMQMLLSKLILSGTISVLIREL